MPQVLQDLIPYIVGGMFFLSIMLFFVALWYFRRGRRDRYWRQRRSASLHGWELFLVSITMAFLASAICLFSGFASVVLEGGNTLLAAAPTETTGASVTPSTTPIYITATTEPENTATETLTSTIASATALHTNEPSLEVPVTPTSAVTPSVAFTPEPITVEISPTYTPTIAVTPTAIVSGIQLTPLQSDITPENGAKLELTEVDSAISQELLPVNPGNSLAAGITRIYFWVQFENMSDGLAWERVLLSDGEVIQGGAYLWSEGEAGTSVYFFGNADGFPAGEYEIRLSFNGDVVDVYSLILE